MTTIEVIEDESSFRVEFEYSSRSADEFAQFNEVFKKWWQDSFGIAFWWHDCNSQRLGNTKKSIHPNGWTIIEKAVSDSKYHVVVFPTKKIK